MGGLFYLDRHVYLQNTLTTYIETLSITQPIFLEIP